MTSTIAFFNNKGGVGKTSLVYHLTWMLSEIGEDVLAVDLDPQANLTSAFLDESQFVDLWSDAGPRRTVFGAINPLMRGVGDIESPHVEPVDGHIGLVAGDLALSRYEDELSSQWPLCLDGKERAFRVVTAFARLIALAAAKTGKRWVLMDVGPNLGAINRAAMVAADHVVVPLGPDLFSLQGLRNLGPTLREWRKEWQDRKKRNPDPNLAMPEGAMDPLGYIVLQHGIRLDRPARAYDLWMQRIPAEYAESVLDHATSPDMRVEDDEHCLGLVKHYHSLVPMAQEARKPLFLLRPADGAIGAHQTAVLNAYRNFEALTRQIITAVQDREQVKAG